MDADSEKSKSEGPTLVDETTMGNVVSDKTDLPENVSSQEESIAQSTSSALATEVTDCGDTTIDTNSTKCSTEVEKLTDNVEIENPLLMKLKSDNAESTSASTDSDVDIFHQDILSNVEKKPEEDISEDFEDIAHDLEDLLGENSESCKLSRGFSVASSETDSKMDVLEIKQTVSTDEIKNGNPSDNIATIDENAVEKLESISENIDKIILTEQSSTSEEPPVEISLNTEVFSDVIATIKSQSDDQADIPTSPIRTPNIVEEANLEEPIISLDTASPLTDLKPSKAVIDSLQQESINELQTEPENKVESMKIIDIQDHLEKTEIEEEKKSEKEQLPKPIILQEEHKIEDNSGTLQSEEKSPEKEIDEFNLKKLAVKSVKTTIEEIIVEKYDQEQEVSTVPKEIVVNETVNLIEQKSKSEIIEKEDSTNVQETINTSMEAETILQNTITEIQEIITPMEVESLPQENIADIQDVVNEVKENISMEIDQVVEKPLLSTEINQNLDEEIADAALSDTLEVTNSASDDVDNVQVPDIMLGSEIIDSNLTEILKEPSLEVQESIGHKSKEIEPKLKEAKCEILNSPEVETVNIPEEDVSAVQNIPEQMDITEKEITETLVDEVVTEVTEDVGSIVLSNEVEINESSIVEEPAIPETISESETSIPKEEETSQVKEISEVDKITLGAEEMSPTEEIISADQELGDKPSEARPVATEDIPTPERVISPTEELIRAAQEANSTAEEIIPVFSDVIASSSQAITPERLICESSSSQLDTVLPMETDRGTPGEVTTSSAEEGQDVFKEAEPLQEVQVSSATQETEEDTALKNKKEIAGSSTDKLSSQAKTPPLPEDHNERVTKPLSIVVDDDTVSSTKALTPKRSHDGKEKKSGHYSPKITIKPVVKPQDEPSIPKVTIKTVTISEYSSQLSSNDDNEVNPLKITIKKQKTEESHSILKIYDPEDGNSGNSIPKLTIKPVIKPDDAPHSPKLYKTHKSSNTSPGQSSPRITIKPVVKTDPVVSPLKLNIKPVLKPEEKPMSPKLTIKPIVKPEIEGTVAETLHHSPRITIKPIVKPSEDKEREQSPIKLTIKTPKRDTSPKITIKPIVKPSSEETSSAESQPVESDDKPERIVLKIHKNSLQESTKKSEGDDVEKSEKLKKVKIKLRKEGGGHPEIVNVKENSGQSLKRPLSSDTTSEPPSKQAKFIQDLNLPDVSISFVHNESKLAAPHQDTKTKTENKHNVPANDAAIQFKLKDMLTRVTEDSSSNDDVKFVPSAKVSTPILISEESDDVMIIDQPQQDPLALPEPVPVEEVAPPPTPVVATPPTPAPKKRGRPRKIPLEVREDYKEGAGAQGTPSGQPVDSSTPVKPEEEESSRPKRSCRGPSARAALGIKERKPRGSPRGRGGVKRGGAPKKETPPKPPKTPRLSKAKIRAAKALARKAAKALLQEPFKELPVIPEPPKDSSIPVVGYEEETRMSAENSSRAQTPARQIGIVAPAEGLEPPEESQSSVQSTATTESNKARRGTGTRLEVVELDPQIISADQLAEYSWGGGGPYMLQEQVAQYLGVKSFKRKYPGLQRRQVDMQERDFIRESGLASEAMCDLGLTAVPSADILDIMYTDFQLKYEEYCKHQRDRQAKDLINKQKALSLATSQEKNKLDITEQAVQSASSWNTNFNKVRKENRRACMDLQTLTINFPKGKKQQISKPPVGNYPIALVPGQFTDYYKTFKPTELKYLPLNSVLMGPLLPGETIEEEEVSDGSQSETDSSSSDSDSSDSDSSVDENCKMCISSAAVTKKVAA